jgi:predicted CXXCH cytochrome family protein
MMLWPMRSLVTTAILIAAVCAGVTQPSQAQPAAASKTQENALPDNYSCILCHRKGAELWTETTPVVDESQIAGDIHWQKGLRCHDCHGGSPTLDQFKNHRNDPTFSDVRSREKIPAFCGKCHSNIDFMRQYNPSARTDQEKEYWTSGHGQHLKASSEGEKPQVDQGVATCVDCHGHHGILAVKDGNSPVYPKHVAETCAKCHADEKHMAGRVYRGKPIPCNQFEQWKQSVHGQAMLEKGDMSAATCNDCHGNHGALPPGVNSVANACGTCHGRIAKLFSETQMKHKFEESGLPDCATCHGKHDISKPTDEMLGMGDRAVCTRCHKPGNPQYGATLAGGDVAKTMRSRLDQLKAEIAGAQNTIQEAERLGMQVRGSRFDLRQAFDDLTNARTLVHSFSPGPIGQALDNGLKVTAGVQLAADGALREYTKRRIWLATSLVPIVIVVGLLLLCIRSLPRTSG